MGHRPDLGDDRRGSGRGVRRRRPRLGRVRRHPRFRGADRRYFLTILLASCGSAAPVAPGARRPKRSRWRCGAPKEHGEASPPSDRCRLALFVARAGPLLSGDRSRPQMRQDGVRGDAMMAGRAQGDAVTDLPLIKAAKLWARVSAADRGHLPDRPLGRVPGAGVRGPGARRRRRSRATSCSWARPASGRSPTRRARQRRSRSRRKPCPSYRPSCRSGRGRGGGEARPTAPEGARDGGRADSDSHGRPASGARAGTARCTGGPEGGRRGRRGRGRAVHRGPARRHRAAMRRGDGGLSPASPP